MTAGLPGIGIGGIFYLFSAILMPLVELINTLRGKGSLKRWQTALMQFSLSCGIISGFWITGIILTQIIQAIPTNATLTTANQTNIFHIQNLWISGTILVLVLGGMRLMNWLIDLRVKRLSKILPSIKLRLPRFDWGR